MAGPSSNPYAGNRHADVLNLEPPDEAGKIRLVDEVKNRAKGAFQQKDMMSAEALYGKAIALLDTMPGKAEAALYSNRSMVRLNLNKVEGALEDARKCLAIDPKFIKAYHRKAQCLARLGEWDEAIEAAEAGLALEPTNKSFEEIIEKTKQDKEKDVEDKAKLKRDAQDVRVELHNASTSRQAQKPKTEKKDGEGEGMRGYKTRADGKTTSYFHTDISDEAKELIAKQGFGKPQKLDAPIEEKEAKGGGSSWNQAGTYEERGQMKWVKEHLPQALKGISLDLPQGGTVGVSAIVDITGDASTTSARGKKKHVLDLSFVVEYELKVQADTGKGKYCYTEVTADLDDDFEVANEVGSDTPACLREVVDAYVKPNGTGLQPLVTKAIKDLIVEFKKL